MVDLRTTENSRGNYEKDNKVSGLNKMIMESYYYLMHNKRLLSNYLCGYFIIVNITLLLYKAGFSNISRINSVGT